MGDHFQPSNGGNALVGVAVALSVVQILFVAARFYTRYLQRVKFGVDDYIVLIALVCLDASRGSPTSDTNVWI